MTQILLSCTPTGLQALCGTKWLACSILTFSCQSLNVKKPFSLSTHSGPSIVNIVPWSPHSVPSATGSLGGQLTLTPSQYESFWHRPGICVLHILVVGDGYKNKICQINFQNQNDVFKLTWHDWLQQRLFVGLQDELVVNRHFLVQHLSVGLPLSQSSFSST